MAHYICTSCLATKSDMEICETEGCTSQWELMSTCECTDGYHGITKADEPTKDCNGNILQNGNSVVLIKDLPLKGTSQKLKQGLKVVISLRDNREEVDCKINGTAIVLRTEFLKKV